MVIRIFKEGKEIKGLKPIVRSLADKIFDRLTVIKNRLSRLKINYLQAKKIEEEEIKKHRLGGAYFKW